MYTKQQFGKELKEQILKKKSVKEIGNWAHASYYEYLLKIDVQLGVLLLQLGTMGIGQEFERSYEELNEIADRLIAGQDVEL